jgi:inorganic pyrophosphatase
MTMKNPYFIPSGEVDNFNVVIEIPKGSHNKYELDKYTGLLFLDRVLPSAHFYPADYGFIPSTKSGDGDAVDVVLLLNTPVPPLTVVKARAVAMMAMIDSGEEDNKIIAVPLEDPRYDYIKEVDDIPPYILTELKDFFENYKRIKSKVVTVTGTHNKAAADKEILANLNNYTSLD